MARRSTDLNYWPAVADVFLAAFLLSLFLWFADTMLGTLKLDKAAGDNGTMQEELHKLQKQLIEAHNKIEKLAILLAQREKELANGDAEIARLKALVGKGDELSAQLAIAQTQIKLLQAKIAKLEATNSELARSAGMLKLALSENVQLKAENTRMRDELSGIIHDKPPVIDLTDRANFKFESGSAAFTDSFKKAFDASPDLRKLPEIVRDYKVDVIEIIGHTDADWNPEHKTISNLDRLLGTALTAPPGDISVVSQIQYGSDADLGLMRAIAVRQLIRNRLQESNLNHIQVRCYSAAQSVIPTGDSALASDYYKPNEPESDRRRIEIRFTRLPK